MAWLSRNKAWVIVGVVVFVIGVVLPILFIAGGSESGSSGTGSLFP